MESTKQIVSLCCVFFIALISCTQQTLNFDQIDDLVAEPVVEASIIYIEVPERIINLTDQRDFFTQEFNFDAFSSDFFAERVIEGTITYEIENTTSKEITVTIEFLDEAGAVLDIEDFLIPSPTPIITREVMYGGTGNSIDIIKNISSFRVIAVNFGGTATTSPFPNPWVTLKTKGEFKLSVL